MREESWEADGCFRSDFGASGDTVVNQDGEGATTKPISVRRQFFQQTEQSKLKMRETRKSRPPTATS